MALQGYEDMLIDRHKYLVTVTGAMDMKALAESLKKIFQKQVEILPPRKEGGSGGGKGKDGGDDKGKGGWGGGGANTYSPILCPGPLHQGLGLAQNLLKITVNTCNVVMEEM